MSVAVQRTPPEAPSLLGAQPIEGISCPVGGAPNATPYLTTPAWPTADVDGRPFPPPGGMMEGVMEDAPFPSDFGGFGAIGGGGGGGDRGGGAFGGAFAAPAGGAFGGACAGGSGFGAQEPGSLGGMESWAWEMGSDAGSMPSCWSAASTTKSSAMSSRATGDAGMIPGLVEGQRLSYVKPDILSAAKGGKTMVVLRKQVPQGYWDHIEILLVMGVEQVKLKPTGIKKGKKLCLEVPAGMKAGDYDVRFVFSNKMLHGSCQLTIAEVDVEGADEDEDDD